MDCRCKSSSFIGSTTNTSNRRTTKFRFEYVRNQGNERMTTTIVCFPRRCYQCGARGHLSRDCEKNQQNSQWIQS